MEITEKNTIQTDNTNMKEGTTYAKLSVPYNDTNVLSNPSPELETVNSYFSSVTKRDADIENLLFEVIGYALYKTSKLSKAFIFYGQGRNGKSKIFRILEALLGNQCSHENLEKLSGSKSGSKSTIKKLEGCTVNIAEDQKQPKYINNSLITKVISGEPIPVEPKYLDDFILIPYATMLFSVNNVIDFKETGLHITDRFVVIPFNETFIDDRANRDIDIEAKLCTEASLQIIATRATQAFNNVLENGKFTIPACVENETNKYFMQCNSVAEFCHLYPVEAFISKSHYYKEYFRWCRENNSETVNNVQFGKQVLSLGYRSERYSFKGIRNHYYVNSTFDNDRRFNIHRTFNLEKEAKFIKQSMTFDNYLWKKIHLEQVKRDLEQIADTDINEQEEFIFDFMNSEIDDEPFPDSFYTQFDKITFS